MSAQALITERSSQRPFIPYWRSLGEPSLPRNPPNSVPEAELHAYKTDSAVFTKANPPIMPLTKWETEGLKQLKKDMKKMKKRDQREVFVIGDGEEGDDAVIERTTDPFADEHEADRHGFEIPETCHQTTKTSRPHELPSKFTADSPRDSLDVYNTDNDDGDTATLHREDRVDTAGTDTSIGILNHAFTFSAIATDEEIMANMGRNKSRASSRLSQATTLVDIELMPLPRAPQMAEGEMWGGGADEPWMKKVREEPKGWKKWIGLCVGMRK